MASGSRQPSFLNNLITEIPSTTQLKQDHTISLLDQTAPAITSPRDADGTSDAERNDSDALATPSTTTPLTKRFTGNSLQIQNSLRQEVAKRKYAKYGRDRYEEESEDATHASSAEQLGEGQGRAPMEGEEANPTQTNYLERGRAKAKGFMRRRRGLGRGKEKEDRVIDILYENQRGWFLFGVPRYSSATLLPVDPRSWQNADFRTSPVDIRNAQVPDPSWEWEWKGWYVDMSRDVDEEGWEYSAFFRPGFNWHGNHPWLFSWVRRRRWLRMRKRKPEYHKTKEKSHELRADYFTIHPTTLRAESVDWSKARTSEFARMHARMEDEPDMEKMDITNIASLMQALRKASVDREKLVAVRKFLEGGEDELYYLPQRIPEIMALFVYQTSRRQLLSELIAHHESAHQKREDLASHDHADADDAKQREHDAAVQHAENLHNAVLAAEEQVRRLEYWSDIKGMANDGNLLHGERWQTGSGTHPHQPFASKQRPEDGVRDLHNHPEHHHDDSSAPSKQSSTWFDAPQKIRKSSDRLIGKSPGADSDASSELDRYTTAEESVGGSDSESRVTTVTSPAQKGREKVMGLRRLDGLGGMDGLVEEEEWVDAREVPSGRTSLEIVTPKDEEGDVVEMENA